MKIFQESEYELLLEYGKNYIAIIKDQPYRPNLGDRLEVDDDCGGVGRVWYEVVSFPNNIFPIHRNRRWLVEVRKSTPYSRVHNNIEVRVYK